jgi:isopenicillin-N epimerase
MREHFLLDPDLVFLNHGSFGACPREVFADYQKWQLELERNPVEFLGRRSGALLTQSRQVLAAHLGADAADLVFVPNATTGVNTVAHSLKLQPGDEVLTTDHEYGACDATWQRACAAAGASYRRVEVPLPFEAASWAERLLAAITPRTRLVFASHISSTTALIFPVAQLCATARQRGVPTLIDGAHAPGHIALDLDALGADFYTGNCHKWLCAPKGSAFLHVRREQQARIDATVVSWGYVAQGVAEGAAAGGHTGFDAYTGHTALERRLQWQGTRDIAAFLAVPAAIDFQQRHGWPIWRLRGHQLACETRRRVARRNGLAPIAADGDHGQMVTIPVRASDAEGLRRHLFEQHRIEVPVTQHGPHTFVRVSVQAYNTQAELDTLVAALAATGV